TLYEKSYPLSEQCSKASHNGFLADLAKILPLHVLWSSFFGHADQMVGLCTGGQLGGRAGQRFVLCG
ncbi:hypothetical protein GRH92_22950, partial [Escherichia coli]|nr:hypothetical protein [Escherichia coli]